MTTATTSSSRVAVYGALLLVQLLFGVHYLAAKVVLREIPPPVWALIRVASAAGLLLLVARLSGRSLPHSPRLLGRLGLYAIFGVVINQWCFVEGLSRTSATHSSILMAAVPVGTLAFALLFRTERLTSAKAASFAVALAGVLLVLRPTGLSGVSLTGDLLILTNGLSYSLFLVISKRMLERVDPLAATAVLLAWGSIGMLFVAWPALPSFDPSTVSGRTWIVGALIVVFPTALAYLLSYWALARVESSLVAFFIYLQPLIATSLSVVLFGERLETATVLGAALIFLAVWITLRKRRRVASVGTHR